MSQSDRWQSNNDAYLGAATEWLRRRLAQLAAPASAHPATTAEENGLMDRLLGRGARPTERTGDSDVARLRATMDQCAAFDPPPAAVILKMRFGLSEFELHILLLCAALELDTRCAGLCARAHGDPAKAYPSYALALALFEDGSWDALSPERPLRFWRLIEITQPPATPLTASALCADERIVNYLKGLNHLDSRLPLFVSPLIPPGGPDPLELAPSHQQVAENLAQSIGSGLAGSLIHLLGPDSASKQMIAASAAAKLSLALYNLPAEGLPQSASELESIARLWQREALLLPLALYVDAKEAERDFAPVVRLARPIEWLGIPRYARELAQLTTRRSDG